MALAPAELVIEPNAEVAVTDDLLALRQAPADLDDVVDGLLAKPMDRRDVLVEGALAVAVRHDRGSVSPAQCASRRAVDADHMLLLFFAGMAPVSSSQYVYVRLRGRWPRHPRRCRGAHPRHREARLSPYEA